MKFWAVLALAAWVAAVPVEGVSLHKRAGELTHIGYRRVNKAEADAIAGNDGNAVQSIGTGARQLGKGIYISPGFQEFPEYDPNEGIPWDCAVTVDAGVWNAFNKAWVPKYYQFPEDRENNPDSCSTLPLWTQRPPFVKNRIRFLTHLDSSFTIENTVLFGVVDRHEKFIQALIPPAIIGSGVIKLKECAERKTESNAQIGVLGPVTWDTGSMLGWNMGPNE